MGRTDVSNEPSFPLDGLPSGTLVRLLVTFAPLVIAVGYIVQWYLALLDYESSPGATHYPLNVVEFIVKPLALGLLPTLAMFFALNIVGHLRAVSRVRTRPHEIVWAYEQVQIHHDGRKPSRSFTLAFVDKRSYRWSLEAPLAQEPRLLLFFESLRWATLGHSATAMLKFASDPRTLYRAQPPAR